MLNMVDSNSFVTLHTQSLVTSNTHDSVLHLMCFSITHNPHPKTPQGYVEIASLQSLKYDGDTTFTQGKHALTFFTSHHSDNHIYKVEFVFYNLFCLRSMEETGYWPHCFLVDPLRGEILRLPACDIQDPNVKFGSVLYGMGFDSLTGTYKMVRVSRFSKGEPGQEFTVTHVFELGTSSWRDIPSVPPYAIDSRNSVSAYGDMHWSSTESIINTNMKLHTCHIVSFDFKKEVFCLLPHPMLNERRHSHSSSDSLHLVTLKGSLSTVDTCLSTDVTVRVEIWVLKDYGKKLWTRDYTMSFVGKYISTIYGYTRSLISLKDYDTNSCRLEMSSTESLNSYGRLVEGGVEDFSLSKYRIMRRISSSTIEAWIRQPKQV